MYNTHLGGKGVSDTAGLWLSLAVGHGHLIHADEYDAHPEGPMVCMACEQVVSPVGWCPANLRPPFYGISFQTAQPSL